jgi:2-amino-4-hydroxy-6-hydroxymethyldihydropteridine diphosphokinase
MPWVAIALGSNLDDRQAHLQRAVKALHTQLSDVTVSAFVETDAVGVPDQPAFLNGALTGWSDASPQALLAWLLDLEAHEGRERPYPGAPRTLDLDLILYGSAVIDEPGLRVPHPRFRDRGFVLEPLASIAPDMIDPETGTSVGEWYRRWREHHACASH